MDRFERLEVYKNKVLATGAVLLASFALASCGNQGDAGTDKINECPDPGIGRASYGEDHIEIGHPNKTHQIIQSAVKQLTRKAYEVQPSSERTGKFIFSPLDEDAGFVGHGVAFVFHNAESYGALQQVFPDPLGPHEYKIDQETTIDDLSEEFCSENGVYYLTPDATETMSTLNLVDGLNIPKNLVP